MAPSDEIQCSSTCRLSGLDRKWPAHGKIDAVDPTRNSVVHCSNRARRPLHFERFLGLG